MKYKNLSGTILIVLSIVLAPLLAEYILISNDIEINNFVAKQLIRYQEIIKLNRVLLCIFYYIFLYVLLKIPTYRAPEKKEATISGPIQIGAGIIGLFALYGFIFFESTPFYKEYATLYPTFILMYMLVLPLVSALFKKNKHKGLSLVKRKKEANSVSINIETTNGGYINIPEPFYHTLILAGSGSGKSVSCITPIMTQFVQKGFCGILFDYKSPVLSNEMNTLLRMYGDGKVKYYIMDFTEIRRCHRLNPLNPDYLKNVNYCEEIAISLFNNMDKDSIRKLQFFERSAVNWLTAVIWFYKKHYPKMCTLPHVLNTILYHDYKHVMSMLLKDPVSSDYIRSITTAIEERAEKQLAGQVASLQNVVASINSPEINWILSGNDFNLNLNDKKEPKILSIGIDPGMLKALAPCVSVIMTVALQNMNVAGKHRSFLMIDEAHSVFIPDLAHVSSVCRSHDLAIVLATQDKSQFIEKYGKEQMDTIFSNMSNQLFGKINHYETAKMISEILGVEEREIIGKSEGKSLRGDKSSESLNQSYSVQEKLIARPEDIMNLRKGEFLGRSTDPKQRYFWGQVVKKEYKEINPIQPFVEFVHKGSGKPIEDISPIIWNNYHQIKKEVEELILQHPKVYK